MIWLLKWLVLGHVHKWKTIREAPLVYHGGAEQDDMGVRYTQQCEHCGIVVKRDLI